MSRISAPHRRHVRHGARHPAVAQRHPTLPADEHRQVGLRQRNVFLVAAPPDPGEDPKARRHRRRAAEEPIAPPVPLGEGRAERVALPLANRREQPRGAIGAPSGVACVAQNLGSPEGGADPSQTM